MQSTKEGLQKENIIKTREFAEKQKEINTKKNKELLDEEVAALNLKKAKGEIKETEYQDLFSHSTLARLEQSLLKF